MKNNYSFNEVDFLKITDIEIDWRIENEEFLALEYNPKLKKHTIEVEGRIIRNRSHARKGIMGAMNKKRQNERQDLFFNHINNGDDLSKIRIVSEGDSWFNYPTRLNEVIDNIFDDYSIFSLAYAGDWLSNIYEEKEYLKALRLYKPDIFLLSGGGNDMVGSRRVEELLKKYTPNATANSLIITDKFDSIIKDFEVLYKTIFTELNDEFPNLKIICHGYDYPYLDGKEKNWLGKPMKRKGIKDLGIRNSIAKIFIDKFNTMLDNTINQFANVHYLDLRGKVPRDQWKDEMHPNSDGFKVVAQLFKEKINGI